MKLDSFEGANRVCDRIRKRLVEIAAKPTIEQASQAELVTMMKQFVENSRARQAYSGHYLDRVLECLSKRECVCERWNESR